MTNTDHVDNHQENNNPDNSKDERGIPSIGQNTDLTKIYIFAFVLIGTIAIAFVAIDGLKKSKPSALTTPVEPTFSTVVSATSNKQYIAKQEQKNEPAPAKDALPVVNKTQEISPLEAEMAKEALRQAKQARLETEQRIASPQIIFEKQPTVPFATSHSTSNIASSSLMENDPNRTFAVNNENANTATIKAKKLKNLSHLVSQGTIIDGILETAIQSDLPGMTRAIVSKNIYSFDSSTLLIPKGSRLIGRYNSALVKGQSRVFVIWNRMIRPDGVSVNISSYGTDPLGRSGLGGEVDTKFFERFGSSVLLSLIDAGLQIGVNNASDPNSATLAMNSGNDFSRAAEIALDNSIAIKPTINIHQGTQIKVFVGKDLDFSDVYNSNPQR